jgi:hypothetical protein
MKHKIKVLLTVVFVGGGAFARAEQVSNTIDTHKDEWVMRHLDDHGNSFDLRIKGKPEFSDDYSDLKSLAPGGSVTIQQKIGSISRKLEITPGGDGQLQRKYSVNGAAHELDAEGKQWMAGIILNAVRQSGFDVERRVAKLFERGGAQAVLDEVAQIDGDYAKSLYLLELLKGRQVDAPTARRVVQTAARDIKSDYEKRQVLSAVSGKYLDDKETAAEFAGAVGTIDSDYDKGQALAALVNDHKLTANQLKVVLPAVGKMKSDHDKAEALLGIMKASTEAIAQPVFFEAVNGIKSDYDRARVLTAALETKDLSNDALKLVVTSATGLSSDYEEAQVLIAAAKVTKDDDVRKQLVEAARTIRSDYERGNALAAATK